MTSRRGGSKGAGVPLPTDAKMNMHHRTTAAAAAPITIAATCCTSIAAGRPIQEAGRYVDEHEAYKERSVSNRTDKNKHVYPGSWVILTEPLQHLNKFF